MYFCNVQHFQRNLKNFIANSEMPPLGGRFNRKATDLP